MRKNGFTLIELLASLTILGLLMIVTVPNIVGILSQNRERIYNEDAKKMISTAKYKLAGTSNGVVKPALNECVVMSLGFLDNGEYDNPPNEGEYLREQSYVVIKKVAGSTSETYRYDFYVRLVEKFDGSLNGIDYSKESDVEKGVDTKKLNSISDVNVQNIDKNYFKNTCGCNVITANYFRIDKKLTY